MKQQQRYNITWVSLVFGLVVCLPAAVPFSTHQAALDPNVLMADVPVNAEQPKTTTGLTALIKKSMAIIS